MTPAELQAACYRIANFFVEQYRAHPHIFTYNFSFSYTEKPFPQLCIDFCGWCHIVHLHCSVKPDKLSRHHQRQNR